MANKFVYVHKNSAASTNRFDYPFAADDEFGEISNDGIVRDSRAVPQSNYMSTPMSATDSGKGYKQTDSANPRLYFNSSDTKKQVFFPKSLFNDFCSVNYSLIYDNPPDLGDDANMLAAHQARYSEYASNVRDANEDAEEFRKAKTYPTIQNIMKYYNQDDPYGMRSYSYTDFAYLTRLNVVPLNYMITLRRFPTPCGDGMIDLATTPSDKAKQLGLWPSYTCIARAVTFMTKDNGNDINNILKFSYGSNWVDEEADIQQMQTNTTLKSQTVNHQPALKNMIYASRRMSMGVPKGGQNYSFYNNTLGPLRQNFADRHIYQGDALVDKYGTGVLGPINCIDKVHTRSRGLVFEQNITLTFEYSLKNIALVNPRAAALDIIANFLTLTGNYGDFWGGATRWWSRPEELGAPVGDIEKLRNGDILGFACSVKDSFVNTISNVFSGSTTEVVEKIGAIVAGGLADRLSDMMDELTPIGAAQVTKALLRDTPTGNWHLVVGNPLDPIATIGNLCVDNVDVNWGPILQGDDFPSTISFVVSLKHGMPRDIGSIQRMFNAGKGRIYTDIDPKVLDAQKSSNAGTANGFARSYHSVFGN